ncbi:hypothetical protein [Sphingomonas glacialis]|uniref:hypothetical protein n=1 Tax=Sphingomonas glacialis TaxID=658225 RepID=UPI0011282034|nr:hypothetical protein [Sphingomonas glacialis]
MAIRRSRSVFLGAVLAVVAVFGMMAVSGWHTAMVHDDDAMHVAAVEHDHAPSQPTDPDAPIHLLAHTLGQWVTIAEPFATLIVIVVADRSWSAPEANFRSGIDPAALLRPPRG